MREQHIEKGEVTLVMNTQGPRAGPTLLFLHAGGESRSVWQPVFARMKPKHWQLIAPDLRGHGDSSRAREYVLDDFVADGYEIIRRLKGRPLVLVGSSLGGLMALMLTMQYPLLIDGLVLLDSPTRLSTAAAKWESQKILEGITQQRHLHSHLDPQLASDQLLADILSDPERLSRAAQSVAVPTLFLHGTKSEAVGEIELAGLRQDIPHVEIERIDAGHLIARDNPAAVAEKIAAFVPTLVRDTVH
ncbi:MAG: alpha/beta hydrolase [Cellvibrionaceae bacterium]